MQRISKLLAISALFLAISATATAPALAASEDCKPPQPTKISIKPQSAKLKYDVSRSVADLQAVEIDTVNPHGFGGASVTQGFMEGQIQMVPSVKLNYRQIEGTRNVCLWYEEIGLKIKIDPKIVLAKEVYDDKCMRAAVVEHEKKHVNVDRRIVNEYAQIVGKKIYEEVKSRGFAVGPIPADMAQATVKRMQDTVFQIVDFQYKRMSLDRQEAQQAVDNIEEYRAVQAKCPSFAKTTAAIRSQ